MERTGVAGTEHSRLGYSEKWRMENEMKKDLWSSRIQIIKNLKSHMMNLLRGDNKCH